jgi:hypothetical protein
MISATMMNTGAADAGMATAIGKGVSRDGRNEHDADDSGGGKRNNGSRCHDPVHDFLQSCGCPTLNCARRSRMCIAPDQQTREARS